MWQQKVNELLIPINAILAKSKNSQEESRLRGEQFNMFRTCGVNHYEVTHSAILAELLNPCGSHGQKDSFLKLFLEVTGTDRINLTAPFDTSTASVQTEYTIHNGRIDILIKNEQHQAIIIENKIYAEDQAEQLKRYNTFAEQTYGKGKYAILYLTLFGEEASEQSCGKILYETISYSKDILEWINKCTVHSISMPIIRETLIQYSNHIKELTNQNMEAKYTEELIEKMAANAEAVAAICNAQGAYTKYVVEKYVLPSLEDFAKTSGLQFRTDNLFKDTKAQGFYFYKPEWNRSAIWFYTERKTLADFYCGISNYSGDKLAVPYQKLNCMSKSPTEYWPYGWEYLYPYKDWDMNTMSDMVNGKYVTFIEQKVNTILEELSDLKLQLE